MHPEASRLFALDEDLRAEAQAVLADSGIGAILEKAGYVPVGSQVTCTMTWRDLDFERYQEPDWDQHWEVGTQLAKTGWCVRLQCVDVYREQWADHGLYWGLRVADPARSEATPPGDPTVWKLDVWTAREEEFELSARERWDALMSEESRATVLAIKEAVCHEPEYRKTMVSAHIYEAVLEQDVGDLAAFRIWWEERVTAGDG